MVTLPHNTWMKIKYNKKVKDAKYGLPCGTTEKCLLHYLEIMSLDPSDATDTQPSIARNTRGC